MNAAVIVCLLGLLVCLLPAPASGAEEVSVKIPVAVGLQAVGNVLNQLYKNSFASYKKCEEFCKDYVDRKCKRSGISDYKCAPKRRRPNQPPAAGVAVNVAV